MITHGFLAVISTLALFLIRGIDFFKIVSFTALVLSLALGALAGVGVQFVQIVAHWFSPALRKLSETLAQQFEGWNLKEIFFVALISSISEELLFRALLQPYLGLWLTSLIFGLAHWTGLRELRIWVFVAILGGLFLGYLAENPHFGIPGCVAAHFLVNLTSLWVLTRGNRKANPASDPLLNPP